MLNEKSNENSFRHVVEIVAAMFYDNAYLTLFLPRMNETRRCKKKTAEEVDCVKEVMFVKGVDVHSCENWQVWRQEWIELKEDVLIPRYLGKGAEEEYT